MSIPNSFLHPKNNSAEKSQLAVLIDFENISISAKENYGWFSLSLLLERIEKIGRITIKRAYGDWDRLNQYRRTLLEEAVELIQLFSVNHEANGKNRADLRIAVDAMELVFTQSYIDTIVIVSGDSDFSSLMLKVREYGKHTIGAGVLSSTGKLLVNSCDDFIYYDDLVDLEKLKAEKCLEQVITENITTKEDYLRLNVLKQKIRDLNPNFDMRIFGCSTLRDYLEEYPKLVRVVKVSDEYVVYRAGAATAPLLKPSPLATKMNTAEPALSAPALSANEKNNGAAFVEKPPAPAFVAQEEETEEKILGRFLTKIGYRPLPRRLKNDLLIDLLATSHPGSTLNQAIKEVKSRFGQSDTPATREQLRTAARLIYQSGLVDFGSERPSLAAVIRHAPDSKTVDIDRVADQVYLRKLAAAGYAVTPGLAAAIFPGEEGRAEYFADLLAALELQGALKNEDGAFRNAIPNLIGSALQHEIFERVRADLEYIVLSEDLPLNRSTAEELLELSINREHDRAFIEGAQTSLKAAKIMAELIHRAEPGISPDEFFCYLAVYCRNKARAEFDLNSLKAARDYFLSFLFILQDGELAWDMKPRMLRLALIHYWAVMASPCHVSLENLESMTAEELLIKIKAEGNNYVDAGIAHLSLKLSRANPGLVRMIIESLKQANLNPILTAQILTILDRSLEGGGQ
jgi:uncharacterized protein (TIGR00288 family)